MEAERAAAIVLRVQPVTESSLIVTWFTRECGKLKTLAKGARRPKSPLRGKIDLFYLDEILFLRSRRSDLHLLHDCFLENPHAKLRVSVPVLTAASYVCELVDAVTVVEDANGKVFDLLVTTLKLLQRGPNPAVLIWFELQLLAASGWKAGWQPQTATGKLLCSLTETTAAGAARVKLSDAQVRLAQEALWPFWDQHVGRPPRSRPALARRIGN
jgi:DNA repair protein RecO (recombination protein O)